MIMKRLIATTLVLTALVGVAPASSASSVYGALSAPTAVELMAPSAMEEQRTITLVSEEHTPFIQGRGKGLFQPDAFLTRAEAAVILYRLLSYTTPATVRFTDVPEDSWYAEAAEELGTLGIMRPGQSTFMGDEIITRGEFIGCVAAFFPIRTDAEQFADVDPGDEYAAAILSARAWGWIKGYGGGKVGPRDSLRRSEAVTTLNRVLGRAGDVDALETDRPALFLDVAPNAWYYTDVMEATVSHDYRVEDGVEDWTGWQAADTGLPADFRTEGRHLFGGWSFYYDSALKDIVRNDSRGGFAFDANGHFTSGDATVDAGLRQIIQSQTNGSMTHEEMRRTLYDYCRDNFRYLKWNYYEMGDTSFTLDAARQMLSKGRGNCYCFASVFWYLCRWLGYDPQIISGTLGTSRGPHSWVEMDGYIYDTQLEWRYVHDYGRSGYYGYFYHLLDTAGSWHYRK